MVSVQSYDSSVLLFLKIFFFPLPLLLLFVLMNWLSSKTMLNNMAHNRHLHHVSDFNLNDSEVLSLNIIFGTDI